MQKKEFKQTENKKGLRFNEGKLRFDLLPTFASEQYAGVMTKGAEKYALRNWEKGMNWTTVLASLKRHVQAFEKGEDYDPETGKLHTAHIMTNAAFLTEYYKTHPQGDDRPHRYLTDERRIGLDIDEVIADWLSHWLTYWNIKEYPQSWNFMRDAGEKFEELKDNEEFWMTIPRKIEPIDIPFEPHAYITSRSIPQKWTEAWLDLHKFPTAPVFTVGHQQSKLQAAKASGINIFVDDRFETFRELNQNGICTYLFTAPHNKRYNVGHKRIHSLKDLAL